MQVTTSVRTSDPAERSSVAAYINSPGALANNMVLVGLPSPEALTIEQDITTTATATTAWESQQPTPPPSFVAASVAVPMWALIGGAAGGTVVACLACTLCACVLRRARKSQVVPLRRVLPQEVRSELPNGGAGVVAIPNGQVVRRNSLALNDQEK
jgi:hypothetical protein